jgi:hypothetical protein
MSILRIILSKIDINFAKMKIHIDDIFSSELLYSFYIKNYLREKRADFGKALFIKINPNESVFWLNNEKVDICYKNCIKKGIFDIIKIASRELDVLEFDVIFDCFKKLNSLDQNENVEFFEIQQEKGLFSVNVSQVAHIFYANILEILMSIKSDIDRKGFAVERVFLSDFEFNYSFLEKISKDVFGVEVFKRSIEDSFRKNISNNNRILEVLKKNADFDDLLCALDFYKKTVNTNLTDSNCDLDSNKITCFLKSFFY